MRKIFISVIKIYQKFVSPVLGKNCRFYPSCSQYAKEAVEEHGLKGVGMSALRFVRCNPLFKGGYDPVPINNKEVK